MTKHNDLPIHHARSRAPHARGHGRPFGATWGALAVWTLASGLTLGCGVEPAELALDEVPPNDTATQDLGGLPGPWSHSDVGPAAIAGTAAIAANGDIALTGAGADIWGARDEFSFLHQPLLGDGVVTARIDSVTATNPWTKVGVMLREGTAAGARHLLMAVTPGNGTAFQRRVVTGQGSLSTLGPAGAAPRYLRLERTGSTFTASVSTDGAAWTRVGTEVVAMPATLTVGVALTSHDAGHAATAKVSALSVTTKGTGVKWHPGHYVFTQAPISAAGVLDPVVERALASPYITGVQVRAMWNRDALEPRKGAYDFRKFEALLAHYQAKGKRMTIISFDQDYWGNDCVPAYMRDPHHPDYSPIYKGGQVKAGNRCVPKLWVPAVMDREIAFYAAMGARFDREAFFEGLSTTETAIPGLGDPDYSNAALVTQLLRLVDALPRAFPHSPTWLEANWTPSTDAVVARAFAQGVGISGPDLTVIGPRTTSLQPSWGFACYNQRLAVPGGCTRDYYGKMPLAIDGQVGLERSIQAGYTMAEIFDFAITSANGLRVSHMFWSQPYLTPGFSFTGTILPFLEAKHGQVMNVACPENLRLRGGCLR